MRVNANVKRKTIKLRCQVLLYQEFSLYQYSHSRRPFRQCRAEFNHDDNPANFRYEPDDSSTNCIMFSKLEILETWRSDGTADGLREFEDTVAMRVVGEEGGRSGVGALPRDGLPRWHWVISIPRHIAD